MIRSSSPVNRARDFDTFNLESLAGSVSTDEEALLLERDGLRTADDTLPTHLPRIRKRDIWSLLRGPEPPKIHSIRPFFPALQQSPIKILASRGIDNRKFAAAVLLFWSLLFVLLLSSQLPVEDGQGELVINLDCVDTLWYRNNDCGIDGVNCHPFSNRSFAFRCPAKCADVQILNPRHVGPVDVNYRSLVIGSGPYRGDSFLCGSAIHAGIVNNAQGGCGRINLIGRHDGFASTLQHDIESIAFDSHFPLSYTVGLDNSFKCSSDPRSGLLTVSLLSTAALAVFLSSPLVFFPIFVLIFAHVSFVSDPPSASHRNTTVLPDHISMFAKRLLPALFVAIFLYRTIVKKTLAGLTVQFEKALFWLGGFWIGALSNYTFDWIPISRLTSHDLEQQPGAKMALAIIIIILVVVIVGQAYSFWLEGRLLQNLGLYGLFVSAIFVCLVIPGVNLRIHHYILALLLLPGTSLQTRPSLLYQGILLGLFVNGIARWDFDSVLQTSAALRADEQLDSAVPTSLPPTIDFTADGLSAAFAWIASENSVDGISVLVNDVERERIWYENGEDWSKKNFTWTRSVDAHFDEYFRWAYLKDANTLDYSKAGILLGTGNWVPER
jgi:hypothetical protein